MAMREPLGTALNRIWEWGSYEVELLTDNNKYMHLKRETCADEHGDLWTGWMLQEGTTFGRVGWLINRHYVPDPVVWGHTNLPIDDPWEAIEQDYLWGDELAS